MEKRIGMKSCMDYYFGHEHHRARCFGVLKSGRVGVVDVLEEKMR
jgi:hypothetical protein